MVSATNLYRKGKTDKASEKLQQIKDIMSQGDDEDKKAAEELTLDSLPQFKKVIQTSSIPIDIDNLDKTNNMDSIIDKNLSKDEQEKLKGYLTHQSSSPDQKMFGVMKSYQGIIRALRRERNKMSPPTGTQNQPVKKEEPKPQVEKVSDAQQKTEQQTGTTGTQPPTGNNTGTGTPPPPDNSLPTKIEELKYKSMNAPRRVIAQAIAWLHRKAAEYNNALHNKGMQDGKIPWYKKMLSYITRAIEFLTRKLHNAVSDKDNQLSEYKRNWEFKKKN